MRINLRPYQAECLEAVESNQSAGIRRQIVHLPTASGKTVVFASLISQAIKDDPSTRAVVLAFSCDLLGQAKDKLLMIDPDLDVGIVDGNSKEFNRRVVVSSVQSARQPRNLKKLQSQGFSMAIADECHHFASDSARLVLRELGFSKPDNGALLIGFSATPFRQDARGLGEDFDKIVYSKTIKEMIDLGFLAQPVGKKIVTDLDLSGVAVDDGDYSSSGLSRVMNTDAINELVVRSYLENALGRKAVAFACSIEHADCLALSFKGLGVRAASIHSQLPAHEKENLKSRFRSGELEVLINPLMLTEGFDEPSIECVIVTRPTKSPGLYQQMVGRGLRLFPNKTDCLVLDFSDHNHTLCNVGVLLEDNLVDEKKSDARSESIEKLIGSLPPNINQKLRKAVLSLDLLGDSFAWQKDSAGNYFLKGNHDMFLKIVKREPERYDAILSSSTGTTLIAGGLDFEYCFGAAEDFAKLHLGAFTLSDLDASWRDLPISEKQKKFFRSTGFRAGIDELTRGQAAQIISSGVLRKRGEKGGKGRVKK